MTTRTIAESLGAPAGRLVAAGEHALHVAEVGQGGRPTVFLHGGGPGCTSWTDYWPTVPFFATDRRCLLVDMLNHGYSDAVALPAANWSFQGDHIALALQELGIEAADFVCNSVGGSAALSLAARYPQLVRRLVVTGSEPMRRGAGPRTPQLGALIRSLVGGFTRGEGPTKEKIREIMVRLEYWDPTAVDENNLELRWHYLQQPGPASTWGSAENMMNSEPEDLEDLMRTVQAPVLVLWGRYDVFATHEYAKSIADTVPNGDFHLMDKAGHHMEEERPRDFAHLVRAWLDMHVDRQ
ncbi:alpha/beta hydrolase [Pseudonocardia sp. NPDC049635]|uniref:alpha/beta fold hydrolase n=1 Tax=Pseudonocardia sp. NPDC049635 TaxID=3155506 RepID=UPI0033F4FC1B